MKTYFIILLIYVLSVFFNRWLNKMICKIERMSPKPVILWLIPVLGTLALIVILTIDLSCFLFKKIPDNNLTNWFKGEKW